MKKFGLSEHSEAEEKKSLYVLTKDGLNRDSPEFKIYKFLFHVMALKREKISMENFSQTTNLGRGTKDQELIELNGKYLEEEMIPSQVAMLILVIENQIQMEDDVSVSFHLQQNIFSIYVVKNLNSNIS